MGSVVLKVHLIHDLHRIEQKSNDIARAINKYLVVFRQTRICWKKCTEETIINSNNLLSAQYCTVLSGTIYMVRVIRLLR